MWSLDEIGIKGTYTIPQIPRIDLHSVSRYDDKTKSIVTSMNISRTPFSLQFKLDQGSYGNVYSAKRGDHSVIVKQPRMT